MVSRRLSNPFYKSSLTKQKKLLLFSFHFPPDQSAGAKRISELLDLLSIRDNPPSILVVTSVPRRHGKRDYCYSQDVRLPYRVKRIYIPFFNSSFVGLSASYLFFIIPALYHSLLFRPNIVFATTAKLLTAFVACISSFLCRSTLYVDIRDTFSDNFFYLYRWKKRIVFQSLIMILENIVMRRACSINVVSLGFADAFYGLDLAMKKRSPDITHFPNGISRSAVQGIASKMRHHQFTPERIRISYAGNLGVGQDLLGLLKSSDQSPVAVEKLLNHNVVLSLYGAGAQSTLIAEFLKERPQLSQVIEYNGLLPSEAIPSIYSSSDCLMLQLGMQSSLSMVIPSKLFEYCATGLPILFGASGFTANMIDSIDGTFRFAQTNFSDFVETLVSVPIGTKFYDRSQFLDRFCSDTILRDYSDYLLRDTDA